LKTLKFHSFWNQASSPHSQKPTAGPYFRTVRCSRHSTYQWSIL